jgi:hypothetical protein
MGLNLPNPRNVFLPELPKDMKGKPEYKYLQDLKTSLELHFAKGFDNTYSILSTGASGTFVDSSGKTVTITNGIITNVST